MIPPDLTRGYNLSKPLDEVLEIYTDSPENLATEMDTEFFQGLKNGFFIEAGASNGKCIANGNREILSEVIFQERLTLTLCTLSLSIIGQDCWWSLISVVSVSKTGEQTLHTTAWQSRRNLTMLSLRWTQC